MTYKEYLWQEFEKDNSDVPVDEQDEAFNVWVNERTPDELSEMADNWRFFQRIEETKEIDEKIRQENEKINRENEILQSNENKNENK